MAELKIALALTINPKRSTRGMQLVLEELLAAAVEVEELRIHLFSPRQYDPDLNPLSKTVIPPLSNDWRRLQFEQFALPRLVHDLEVDALVMPFRGGPIGSRTPLVALDLLATPLSGRGVGGRLLRATRLAAAQGAQARVVFGDLIELEKKPEEALTVDPWVSPDFRVLTEPDDRSVRTRFELPSSYALACGVSLEDIPIVLAAWTWVDGSVGDSVPLAVVAAPGGEQKAWQQGLERMGLAHSVSLLDGVSLNDLPALFRHADAFIQGGSALQAQIMRWAMSCGVPVVGFETPPAVQVLGPAGYLVPPGDTRALGAACLTVIVEPEVSEGLRQRGLLRASGYHAASSPLEALLKLIQSLDAGS